jgi:hypothetical protein
MADTQTEIGAENFYADASAVAATASATDFPVAQAYDRKLYTFWKDQGGAGGVIQLDMGSTASYAADYVGIIGHNFGTVGARVRIQSTAAGGWFGPIITHVDINPAADDFVIYRSFTNTTAYRYWRLRYDNATSNVQVAMLSLGRKVSFPFSIDPPQGFDPRGERAIGVSQLSNTGNHLGSTTRYIERRLRVTFKKLDSTSFVDDATAGGLKDWVDNFALTLTPFFFAWNAGDPGSYEKDTLWARLPANSGVDRTFVTTVQRKDVSFTMLGMTEE